MMTDEYLQVHFLDLPSKIKAFATQNDDGSYTIIINAHLSHEAQFDAYLHELHHILQRDFSKNDAREIESTAHSTDIASTDMLSYLNAV